MLTLLMIILILFSLCPRRGLLECRVQSVLLRVMSQDTWGRTPGSVWRSTERVFNTIWMVQVWSKVCVETQSKQLNRCTTILTCYAMIVYLQDTIYITKYTV